MGKESCVDKESLGDKNIHIKSTGFHSQNPMRIFPLWQSNKIPGKQFKFPSQNSNVAIGQ